MPAAIVQMLNNGVKRSNQEMIIDYIISDDKSIVLTQHQEELYRRWNMAHDLLQSKRYKSTEIVRIMCNKWKYSKPSALRDMDEARFVFGMAGKYNKKFYAKTNIDRLNDYYMELRERGEDELAIRLSGIITNAIKDLPDDGNKEAPPTAIVFNIENTQINLVTEKPITESEAAEVANKVLAEKGITIDLDDENYSVDEQ